MSEIYLGDGLYFDGNDAAITLSTQRNYYQHFVVLEPDVFANFIRESFEIKSFRKILKEVIDEQSKNNPGSK